MILTLKCSVTTGSAVRGMRTAGALDVISWEVRSSIIGMSHYIISIKGKSQLTFDPRFDTSRFIIEHYVDGDLVNDQQPTNRTLAKPDNLHVWGRSLSIIQYIHRSNLSLGPDLPPTFLQ
jgi:hypothetical protein